MPEQCQQSRILVACSFFVVFESQFIQMAACQFCFKSRYQLLLNKWTISEELIATAVLWEGGGGGGGLGQDHVNTDSALLLPLKWRKDKAILMG